MKLERQERAYNDSLEKYSTLLDTAQVRYYFDLHKAVLDTLGVVMQQEAEAFMAAKDREAANEENSSMTTAVCTPAAMNAISNRRVNAFFFIILKN
jgi:hypothetical protein